MNVKKVLIVGGTGFVGQQIGIALARKGFQLFATGRKAQKNKGQLSFPCELFDLDDHNHNDLHKIFTKKIDIVINLAGTPIVGKRWTSAYRKQIRSSRVDVTKALTDAILKAEYKPEVYLQSSAIGYYGDRADEILDESSVPGKDFLGQLCVDWENASRPLETAGIRRIILRHGIILGLTGGALPQLMSLYLKRLGAVLGNGKQWLSWIHIADVVSMFVAAIELNQYDGPINCTSPNPVRFKAFHAALNQSIGITSPAFAPKLAVKAILGKSAVVVLGSQRCQPSKVNDLGFVFQFPTIEMALQDLIESAPRRGAQLLVREQWIAKTPDQLWHFFANEQNLEKLSPRKLKFKILDKSTEELQQGTLINYWIRVRGVPMRWRTLIAQWQPPQSFTDIQLKGPYKTWHHVHKFEELAGGTLMTDQVTYILPFRFLANLTYGLVVDKDVEEIFSYRRKMIAELFNAR